MIPLYSWINWRTKWFKSLLFLLEVFLNEYKNCSIFDATNMLSDVTSGRFVSVYSKINNKWKAVDRFTLSEVIFSSIDQPELYAKELLKQLGNIDVIVGKSFSDLFYNEFLKNNVAVATAHNFGKGLLKKIESQYISGKRKLKLMATLKFQQTLQPLIVRVSIFLTLSLYRRTILA